ncbi:MAG: sulfite exporter TauE/SafE family protein, partial [candidate division NC10 bacterium]
MTQTAELLLAGIAAGVFGTVLGLGGGIFLVPELVLALKLPMHSAVGASLVAIVATSSAGASKNVAAGLANMRLGLSLETMTVAGALCGGLLAPHLPARLLVGLFGVMLLAATAMLWLGGPSEPEAEGEPRKPAGVLGGEYRDPASGRMVVYSVERLPAALGASLAAGVVSALFGVGGGLVGLAAVLVRVT